MMPIHNNFCITECHAAFPKMCGISLLPFLILINQGWPIIVQSSAPAQPVTPICCAVFDLSASASGSAQIDLASETAQDSNNQ